MGFIAIQQTHTTAIEGAIAPPLRTGYESVVPYRVGDLYATHAPQDGVVTALSEKGIIVSHKDGTTTSAVLGRRYGRAEGHYYPHDVITHLKLGDKVKKDYPIAWNNGFFELDYLNPGKLVLRYSTVSTVALMENDLTFEDSNASSDELATRLTTTAVKLKSVVLRFDQAVHKVVRSGDVVGPDQPLLLIEEGVSNDLGLFDEKDLEALKRLSGKSPKAGVQGTVDRVEMLYHGDREDMSATLRKLARETDAALKEQFEAVGLPVMTGKVDSEYRVGGSPLLPDTLEVRFFISYKDKHGTADKNVIGNQMKTTTAKRLNFAVTTKDGRTIDAWFSYRSFNARIANSPIRMGTTLTVLGITGEVAHDMYFNQ